MDFRFDFITNLQYRVQSLTSRLKAFESGEKYTSMEKEFERQLAQKNREIKKLKLELGESRQETADVRKKWMQTLEDIVQEHENTLEKKDAEIARLEDQILKTRIQLDEAKDKLHDKNKELYEVKTQLEDEQGKNLKLTAQVNRDFENSSISSSMKANRKKITNNREKSGKKRGGQTGHEGHRRKKHAPTEEPIHIPAPEMYTDSPDYKPTGRIITKQVVNLRVSVDVTEYDTPEFRNIHTGQRVHAEFPSGVVNDVNYGGSVKAFAFLLNTRCCVSIDKVTELISELSGGELQLSKGMISGLCKEFSAKTEDAQQKAFSDLLLSPVMHIDFTNAKVNGHSAQVAVCATPSAALYFAREHKGKEGVKGTPAEHYVGPMVHDHDLTFYNYGSAHQECLDHVLRYLKDSIQNEPSLEWNQQMRDLLREMIHHKNGLEENTNFDPEKVEYFTAKYLEVLDIARKEYEYEPPSKYYREGFNLFTRLEEFMDSHLLFLKDADVPTNNNLSERLLRIFKRKQKQMMTFRSFESLSYTCACLSMIAILRADGKNLFDCISAVFD